MKCIDRHAKYPAACLTATAPDLLKACEAALKYVRGTNMMGDEIEPRLVKKLCDAIAKAKGETKRDDR